MALFPTPQGGASLLLSFRPVKKTVLIIGSGPLAASRAFAALEADAVVVILAKGGLEAASEELRWRAQQAQLTIYDLDATSSYGGLSELETIEKLISRESTIALVCVTDTILGGNSTDPEQVRSYAQDIYRACSALNIPVNITDIPELCDFSFASTHRFLDPITGEKTALQIGVTTNGKGCRLAGRLRRDIVSRLPKEAGSAVETVGALRVLAKSEARKDIADDETAEDAGVSTPNRPVAQRHPPEAETMVEKARRRMRWVTQVSEYWPIERLGRMSEAEMQEVMRPGGAELAHQQHIIPNSAAVSPPSLHSLTIAPTQPPGKILLVGSGPGLPSLLTLSAHTALTKQAQLVLSDKLVPASVLALIPPGVEVRIARKFPGNADGAQEELMETAVEAARQGKVVVRVRVHSHVLFCGPGGWR
jgi:uroporphyrin-III C-methyltransferase